MKGLTFKDGNEGDSLSLTVCDGQGGQGNLKILTFNGGEEHVNFSILREISTARITLKGGSSSSIMRMLMLKDALDQRGAKNVELFMPYIPYARQDRPCADGDAFSLRVFCKLINGAGFSKVSVVDPHSDVAPALLDNCNIMSLLDVVSASATLSALATDTSPVSPDAGANKKVFSVSKYGAMDMIRADKSRCVRTGDIISTEVFCANLCDQPVTIWDDICDGGRTFIELAKELKRHNAGEINLFVTHGIFAKGYQCLLDSGISHIFTTDSLNPQEHENVTIIKL